MEVFDAVLGDRPNQLDRLREDVAVKGPELLSISETPGAATIAGLRNNISVGIQYLAAWLGGNGAVAIFNLMEDAATAEISRSQIWQWIHHGVQLEDGSTVTPDLVRQILDEETGKIHEAVGDEVWQAGRPDDTREIFELVALSPELLEFLTLPAYRYLD
jgi:malate synthase